jgi:hypothetical protein
MRIGKTALTRGLALGPIESMLAVSAAWRRAQATYTVWVYAA